MGAMWTPLAQSTFRLSVTVSTLVKERIDRLKQLTGLRDVSRVVGNALAMYEAVTEAIRDGRSHAVVHLEGEVDASTITIGFKS